MLQELDNTFQAVALIGYHSRAGSGTALWPHLTGKLTGVKLNDRDVSEFLIDAYTCAYVGVPLIFLSGDKVYALKPRSSTADFTVAVKKVWATQRSTSTLIWQFAQISAGMVQAVKGSAERIPALRLTCHRDLLPGSDNAITTVFIRCAADRSDDGPVRNR